jgi:hypothetical protein
VEKFNWRRVWFEERDRRARWRGPLLGEYELQAVRHGRRQSTPQHLTRTTGSRRRKNRHPLSLGDVSSRVDGLRIDASLVTRSTWVPRLHRYFEYQHGLPRRRSNRSS